MLLNLSSCSCASTNHSITTANVSNATGPSMDWTAGVLQNLDRSIPLHLYLFNAEDSQCLHCHSNSSMFEIAQAGDTTGSNSTAATDSGTATTPSQSKLPLGMGLGLGLPLLVLVVASAILLYRRRGKKARADGGSQTAAPLVDSEVAYLTQGNTKAELQGQEILELPVLENIVEAPAFGDLVELEGDDGRR